MPPAGARFKVSFGQSGQRGPSRGVRSSFGSETLRPGPGRLGACLAGQVAPRHRARHQVWSGSGTGHQQDQA
jgi:hypothetical protein